ncbi:hypothetical protein GTW43_11360, partial [Streptomyces sp. SID5785]|nr:hypothetical protein [Streptomyces sp. SID5785]
MTQDEPAESFGSEIFDDVPMAVLVTFGPGHRIAYANASHRRLLGAYPVGTPARAAFP